MSKIINGGQVCTVERVIRQDDRTTMLLIRSNTGLRMVPDYACTPLPDNVRPLRP